MTSHLAKANQIEAFSHHHVFTNALSVKSILEDDWQTPPSKSGDYGFSQSLAGISVNLDNWQLSAVKRKDYFLRTNPDSLRLYHHIESEFPEGQNELYGVDINYRRLKAKGLKLSYTWCIGSSLELTGRLGLWQPEKARHSFLVGNVSSDDSKESDQLTGTAELEEWYTWSNLLKRPGQSKWADSSGVTFDTEVFWTINDKLNLNMVLGDFYSNFQFAHLGYSKGSVNSETSFKDDKNITRFNPAYSGIESEREKVFELPTYRSLTLNFDADVANLVFQYERRDIMDFYRLGINKNINGSMMTFSYEFAQQSLQFEFNRNWLQLMLATDDLNISKAKQIKLSAVFTYQFGT